MLEQKIQENMVEAMKNKNEFVRDTLRLVKSEINVFKTSEAFVKRGEDITDEDIQAILEDMVKRNKKNIDTAKAANREDIVKKNEDEIAIFESYLPKKMTEAELEPIVKEVISDTGATTMKDMGKVICGVSEKVGKSAEKKLISEITKRLLS